MILPATYLSGLLLMILALACAGSWTSTFKAASPFRYELYYFDFSIGAVLCAVVAALTLGSLRSSELTFADNFLITGYRLMAYAVGAGMVFNLGNVILLAGISVGGMALCVPLAFGIALIINATWDFLGDPRINPLLLFGGVAAILAAVVLLALAHFWRRSEEAEAAKKALQLDPRSKEAKTKKPRSVAAGVAVALAIFGGVILAFSPRLLDVARESETGVAPYGLTLLFAAGVLFSTMFFSPFVINFPIGGMPAPVADYFRVGIRRHLLGILGGVLLCAGALAGNIVIGSAASALLKPSLVMGLAQVAPLVAFLWGVIIFKEFRGASQPISALLWGGFLLYALGGALISVAPLYGSR